MGKRFSFWDYKEWYSSLKKGKFTYTSDWSGFNLPLKIAVSCKEISRVETPYDKEMNKAINKICKTTDVKKAYLIGVDSIKSNIFKHELAHALYYTDKVYKKSMDELTMSIGKKKLELFKIKLRSYGYCEKVLIDEIQAYLSTEDMIFKNVPKRIYKSYKNNFNKWYIKLNNN